MGFVLSMNNTKIMRQPCCTEVCRDDHWSRLIFTERTSNARPYGCTYLKCHDNIICYCLYIVFRANFNINGFAKVSIIYNKANIPVETSKKTSDI